MLGAEERDELDVLRAVAADRSSWRRRARAGVVRDQADALARAAARSPPRAARRCRSAPAATGRRRDGARRAEVAAGPDATPRRGRQARHGRRGDRRDARAQRRHVALAVGMDPVRQEDDEHLRGRIDPDRRAREAGVAERADRQQLAAVGRERRVDVPAEAAHVRSSRSGEAGARHLRDRRAARGSARRCTRRRRAACGRRSPGPRPC